MSGETHRAPAPWLPVEPPVTVGFIGAGSVLEEYLGVLDGLQARGLATVGPVLARSEVRREALRRGRPAVPVVEAVEDVLDASDLVVVATPSDQHASFVQMALERGRHVVSEKPLAPTGPEAAALASLARERERLLVTSPYGHLSPTIGLVAQRVRGGDLGRVHTAAGFTGAPDMDFAPWYYTRTRGGFSELSDYLVKLAVVLLGPVESVIGAAQTDVAPIGVVERTATVPDVGSALLRHTGGAVTTITAGWAFAGTRMPALELHGDRASLAILGEPWTPAGYAVRRRGSTSWELHDDPDPAWSWNDGLRDAVEALVEGRPPRGEIEHDVHVIAIMDAVREAARARAEVAVAYRAPSGSA